VHESQNTPIHILNHDDDDKKTTNRTQQPWEALVIMNKLSKLCTIQSTAPKKKPLTFVGGHKGTQTKIVKLDEIEVVWNMAAKASKNCNVPQI
jgi:hypothetical protein